MAHDMFASVQPATDLKSWVVTSLSPIVAQNPDFELRNLFHQSHRIFDEIVAKQFPRWVVTFSGGKDSTLTTILAADYVASLDDPPALEVVYADTLQEIPQMRASAGKMMQFLGHLGEIVGVRIKVHVVTPALEDRFWVRMIGRGYPPPKPRFRWCTHRLKIKPSEPHVYSGRQTAVLTGVRLGESPKRTARLNASCTTGGECGQDFWIREEGKRSEVTYFAPILTWRTCKVWDFLHFVAPAAGWPTGGLVSLYGDTTLRFGCWNCSLVERDRTMEELSRKLPETPLAQLLEFRNLMVEDAARRQNRLMRNGHVGPLSMEYRRELLSKLLTLQKRVGMEIVTDEEIAEIKRLWKTQAPLVARLPRAA